MYGCAVLSGLSSRRILPLTLLAVFTALLAPPVASAQVFSPQTATLDNGLQIVVLSNHRVPVVHHMIWYKVGSADEPPGKSGIAHLLEHMMFKGTTTVPAGEFSRLVARNGGRDNAFTGSDYTGYFQTISKQHLEMVMTMEADRMINLSFADEDFLTELEVVREERRARTDTEPSALLSERMDQALWVVHPYKNPIIGWEHELKALTKQDALDFYDAHYGPDNAVVLIAGDVTLEEVLPIAQRTYGTIAARDIPDRQRLRTLPIAADTTITLHHPQVRQPSIQIRHIAPSYALDPEGQTYALQVLSEILGGTGTGRLYRELVMDQSIAVSVAAWYRPTAVDWSTFGLYAMPAQGHSIDSVRAALEAEVGRIIDEGVPETEVERAKARLTAQIAYAQDSLSSGARSIGARIASGGTAEDVEAWPEGIASVTAAQVVDAARAVLREGRAVTGILLPDGLHTSTAQSDTPVPSDS